MKIVLAGVERWVTILLWSLLAVTAILVGIACYHPSFREAAILSNWLLLLSNATLLRLFYRHIVIDATGITRTSRKRILWTISKNEILSISMDPTPSRFKGKCFVISTANSTHRLYVSQWHLDKNKSTIRGQDFPKNGVELFDRIFSLYGKRHVEAQPDANSEIESTSNG